MPTSQNLGTVLGFLDELSKNNNKAWFEARRPDYQTVRSTYERFIDDLIDVYRASDHLQALSARDCIPRIYRDIRFLKDKTPYKTNLGALIAPGGWKSFSLGYYISIEPHNQSMAAGGLYDPSPEQLTLFRQAIDRDAAAFRKVTAQRDFVAVFGAIQGSRLKTAPKGYDRNHPEIVLLQLKQVTVVHHFSDQEVLTDDFKDQVVTACRAMRPFLDYLTDILQ
jgi:uncharacterized protein (TIGR02453 family)